MIKNEKNRLRVAIVGCGAVSEIFYAVALSQLAKKGIAETIALVDPNPDRTSKIGIIFPTAKQYRDLGAMLADNTPDLAVIATPHRFHADLTVACLEQGIHVLCEKPMATTTAECEQMIEASEKNRRLLAVGHFRRFFASCQFIKEAIDKKYFGEVIKFHILEGEKYSWPAQSVSFFKKEQAGGGVLIDTGAHTIDLLLWWLGDVFSFEYQDDAMGGVESNCLIHINMKDGATGIVQLSRDWPLQNKYKIEFEKGWITYACDVVDRVKCGFYNSSYLLNAELEVFLKTSNNISYQITEKVPSFSDCFSNQLKNVINSISGKEVLKVPGTEAIKAVHFIEDCYKNRKLLNMNWLNDKELKRAIELAHV